MVGFYRKVCLGKQKGWKPVKPVQCLSSTAVDEEINQVNIFSTFIQTIESSNSTVKTKTMLSYNCQLAGSQYKYTTNVNPHCV